MADSPLTATDAAAPAGRPRPELPTPELPGPELPRPRPLRPRLLAALLDYCVVLGWLAVLAAVFVPLYAADLVPWRGHVDLVSFAGSVVPVWLYLTVTEAGAAHATWGKRRLRLVVQARNGGAAGPARIAARNAVKLLPWACAHLGIAPLWAGSGAGTVVSPALAWVPITAAYLIAGATVASVLVCKDRAALHDLVAGTRVGRAPLPATVAS
ncbi:RDD family protein [Rugosimonospora africana]|uniref:RDD domain-containing protein n=1 Tax=Rugosimonospora africana TaxID=556532 RepID=A0A8J3VTA0_9ACTN|nr:RDD family protein [Rugosimonospora africana]GIH17980.1 hypothetical protein Raf01_61520 [Rugosimonospora africana]